MVVLDFKNFTQAARRHHQCVASLRHCSVPSQNGHSGRTASRVHFSLSSITLTSLLSDMFRVLVFD